MNLSVAKGRGHSHRFMCVAAMIERTKDTSSVVTVGSEGNTQ
jgi:hypothetical protein